MEIYIGSYSNAIENFFIEIGYNDDKTSLQVAYMGRDADTFKLMPYQNDSFFWTLTHDESARLARDPTFPADYHILKFGSMTNGSDISCLWWKHQSGLQEPGEIFKRMDRTASERHRGDL